MKRRGANRNFLLGIRTRRVRTEGRPFEAGLSSGATSAAVISQQQPSVGQQPVGEQWQCRIRPGLNQFYVATMAVE